MQSEEIRKRIEQANGIMAQVQEAVKKQNAAAGQLGAAAVPLEIALPLQCMLAQWEIALQLAVANEQKALGKEETAQLTEWLKKIAGELFPSLAQVPPTPATKPS